MTANNIKLALPVGKKFELFPIRHFAVQSVEGIAKW